MTSIILSAIGLILAIAVFIILCMKGTGAIFASVIATMIIAVTANGGFTENFFTVFMTGTMGFMQNMLLLFITGALFGGLLNITGCNDSIGRTLTRVLGQKNVLYIIMVFSMVVAATGGIAYHHRCLLSCRTNEEREHAPLYRYVCDGRDHDHDAERIAGFGNHRKSDSHNVLGNHYLRGTVDGNHRVLP